LWPISNIFAAFGVKELESTVSTISRETGSLLEIVNYNVSQRQYVCAGTLRNLRLLTDILNELATMSKPTASDPINELIQKHVARNSSQTTPVTSVERGKATIPLAGIDVPFHSSFLRPNLEAFREVLEQNIQPSWMDPDKLVGRYIPNVTAKPFDISKEAFEYAWEVTKSDRLRKVLDNWQDI
jgi:fatty acid synthase subunit beta